MVRTSTGRSGGPWFEPRSARHTSAVGQPKYCVEKLTMLITTGSEEDLTRGRFLMILILGVLLVYTSGWREEMAGISKVFVLMFPF